MIHTIEISRMISREVFFEFITQKDIFLRIEKHNAWFSDRFQKAGIISTKIYRFKRRKDYKSIDNDPNYYMITLTLSPAAMCGGDYHSSINTISFSMPMIIAMYRSILDCFPALECNPEKFNNDKEIWLLENSFFVRRIDFAMHIKEYAKTYLRLIDRGYSLRIKNYLKKCYNSNSEIEKKVDDDEPVTPDDIMGNNSQNVYYSGNSANVNIYHKLSELQNRNLPYDVSIDYDFLRLEVQVKKNKLNYLIKKYNIASRKMQDILVPEMLSIIEKDVLENYICLLTGKGAYVTIGDANKIIDNSDYSNPKRQRLKELIYTISKRGGIANTLQLVENGTIKNLGTVSTIKGYLKIIQNLGINPVVLSRNMDIPLAKTIADSTRNGVRIRRFLINPSDYVHEYLSTTSQELSSVFELSTKEQ